MSGDHKTRIKASQRHLSAQVWRKRVLSSRHRSQTHSANGWTEFGVVADQARKPFKTRLQAKPEWHIHPIDHLDLSATSHTHPRSLVRQVLRPLVWTLSEDGCKLVHNGTRDGGQAGHRRSQLRRREASLQGSRRPGLPNNRLLQGLRAPRVRRHARPRRPHQIRRRGSRLQQRRRPRHHRRVPGPRGAGRGHLPLFSTITRPPRRTWKPSTVFPWPSSTAPES